MRPLAPFVQRLSRPFAYLLYGLALLFLFKTVGQLWSQHQFKNKVEASVAALSQEDADDPAVLQDALAEQKKRADAFMDINYFYAKPAPKIQLTTIFSEEALINGSWKKIGDRVNDATIKRITSVSVTLETDGKERTLFIDGYSAASADEPWIQNPPTPESTSPEIENDAP